MPGSTTFRASTSASMMGSEYGRAERMEETVDLPVAIDPVRPRRSIVEGRLRIERNEIRLSYIKNRNINLNTT